MLQSDGDAWRRRAFNVKGPASADGRARVLLSDLTIAESVGRSIPAAALDLVELVAAVHLVDRLERRPGGKRSGESWSRQLHLQVGVRDPDLWSDSTVSKPLVDLLQWLTDDEWRIDFTQREAPDRAGEVVQFLFDAPPAGDVVALFSGGLDSLAGLFADVQAGARPLAVSVETNSRVAKSQRDVLAALNQELDAPVHRVPVPLHLLKGRAVEASQRARGFTFLALASVVASVADVGCVHVYENGIGAINLPYTDAQTGAHGTRAMHPLTLRLAARLFGRILERSIEMVNMSQFTTKGEMCSRLPTSLDDAVRLTESCDTAFSHRVAGAHSCGTCTSCLLRRHALLAAGRQDLDSATPYRLDAFSVSDPARAELYDLRAMLSQAARMNRAVSRGHGDTWPSLLGEFPDLSRVTEGLGDGGSSGWSRVGDMLRRYLDEWAYVPSPLVPLYLSSEAGTA